MSNATKNNPFSMRMRPRPKALLARASEDERRSMASIIEALILERYAERYAEVSERLDSMFRAAR